MFHLKCNRPVITHTQKKGIQGTTGLQSNEHSLRKAFPENLKHLYLSLTSNSLKSDARKSVYLNKTSER